MNGDKVREMSAEDYEAMVENVDHMISLSLDKVKTLEALRVSLVNERTGDRLDAHVEHILVRDAIRRAFDDKMPLLQAETGEAAARLKVRLLDWQPVRLEHAWTRCFPLSTVVNKWLHRLSTVHARNGR